MLVVKLKRTGLMPLKAALLTQHRSRMSAAHRKMLLVLWKPSAGKSTKEEKT